MGITSRPGDCTDPRQRGVNGGIRLPGREPDVGGGNDRPHGGRDDPIAPAAAIPTNAMAARAASAGRSPG